MDKISIAQRKCRCNPAGAMSGLPGSAESPAGKFHRIFEKPGRCAGKQSALLGSRFKGGAEKGCCKPPEAGAFVRRDSKWRKRF